jgi:cob(I)alamin adenosyltransferase
MVKIYSRGHNSTNPPTPDSIRNLASILGPSEELRDLAIQQTEALSANLALAKAFSNQTDAKALLDKIQHRLFGLNFIIQNRVSPTDPTALSIINQATVDGLANCIAYFGNGLPLTMKQIIPGLNKAGATIHLAHISAKHASATLRKMAEADNDFVLISDFLKNLAALLTVLERYEYKASGLEEQYWN